jgi:hypothetical protein
MACPDPMRPTEPNSVRVQLLMTPRHREMLHYIAHCQRRTMASAMRVAIERIYEIELLAAQKRETAAAGNSRGSSTVIGRS